MQVLPLLLLALPHACTALITLPSIFTDGAVLQTREEYGARAYVYGWAEPAETVTVGFALAAAPPSRPATNYTVVADATGYFIVTLDPLSEAAFSLAVSGSVSNNTVVVKDCVGGDVYLCVRRAPRAPRKPSAAAQPHPPPAPAPAPTLIATYTTVAAGSPISALTQSLPSRPAPRWRRRRTPTCACSAWP